MCGKSNPADSDTCQYCQARLKPLTTGPVSEPQPTPSQPSAPDNGDWLSDFRTDDLSEAEFEESEASSDSSDFGDWFSRLEEPAETEQPAEKLTSPEDESLPDWLKAPQETPTPSASAEEEKEPDWLKQFHEQATDDAVPGPGKSYEDSGVLGATDWLAGLGSVIPVEEQPGQAELEPELPDWMKPELELGPSQETSPAQESVPDWLREAGIEPAATKSFGFEAEESEESEAPAETDESAELAAESGEMPDWLKSQMPASAQEEMPSIFAETGPEPEEADWSKAETPAAPEAGVPDWLTEASTPAAGTFAGPAEQAPEPSAEESTADWFSKLGITSEEKPAAAIPAFVMSDDDLAPFVSGDEMAAEETVPGELESLPDWLSQIPAEQEAPPPESPPARAAPPSELESEPDVELAPAQLPSWLQAMRPVEAAAPATPIPTAEEGPVSIETAGPLAGLRGILPAEAEIARISKPPVYSIKLQVSEAHQARVSLLEELIAAEGKPKPVAPYVAIAPQTILRLAITLILVLAVFGALWIGEGYASLPDPQSVPQELEDLRGQIEALSTNATVLVSFDYEPGYSGEMESAAGAVISHLVEKRVPLWLVSTNPLGPGLAERLVKQQVDELNSQLLPNTTPYTTSLFTNLGYIPGGIAGLRAFAETPAKILPHSISQQEVWTSAPLTSSTTLAGFTLALVITDNPDTAQAWVEQAEPILKPSPLLLILSAQAEPLIRSYYDSGQVQGMVTGLAGGAAYENKRGRSGPATQSWDAFSLSSLAGTLLILIGGLVNASLASIAGRKRKGEEQPYA
jgi:hypothetical protein